MLIRIFIGAFALWTLIGLLSVAYVRYRVIPRLRKILADSITIEMRTEIQKTVAHLNTVVEMNPFSRLLRCMLLGPLYLSFVFIGFQLRRFEGQRY